ncbi:ParA family protein [Paroceanicella profunda]|uniref:ParA family protein n=1 Tax=Paroceanicella profunda TaxID=2579971 RepID=A0A5B8FG10_9RHOB|nr:ParA family protein [Paroceanicella profunda]QDL90557.1 ParA family protein [Paroceanicella profunda]
MATTLLFTQAKGGAGKTMLLTQLAALWLGQGRRVGIVDLDPQRSASGWAAMRAAAPDARPLAVLIESADWRASSDLREAQGKADLVLVDTAGHAEALRLTVMSGADAAIVPCQPSMSDVWATASTLTAMRDGKLPFTVVLNRMPPRGRTAEAAIAALEEAGAPLAEARVGSRSAFADAFMQGAGATEIAARSRAAQEIRALGGEIGRLVGL